MLNLPLCFPQTTFVYSFGCLFNSCLENTASINLKFDLNKWSIIKTFPLKYLITLLLNSLLKNIIELELEIQLINLKSVI